MAVQRIRPSVVAGHFYEPDAQKLYAYVEGHMKAAHSAMQEGIVARPADVVVLPHAGHMFCAHIIAQTLAHVTLPKKLFILCPNHTGRGEALAIWAEGAWQTPLGDVPVAESAAQMLLDANAGFAADTLAHMREHSLEVLLPFLQQYIPEVRIIPIAVGTSDILALRAAGHALGRCVQTLRQDGEDTSIIVSSDMHHFADHVTTLALDNLAIRAFMTLDPVALHHIVTKRSISMCGVYAAVIALYAKEILGGNEECILVNHTTSFEKGGDARRTVGYAGLFVASQALEEE